MAPASSQLIQSLEITNLPSLPHVLLRLLDACNRNETSLKVIAEIINKDAALSSKVIGASGSALFGKPNNLTTFEQKLIMLGLDMVRTIAISASVYQVFSNLTSSPEFDLKSFWGRSLTSATLAKLLAQETAYPHPEEAYLTGLLLDVGQLVLWSNFPKQYATLSADVVDDVQLMQRETEEIGSNHCQVGAWLAGNWHLNSFMADAILYHHVLASRVVDAHPLIRIAHVANSLSLASPDGEERLADGAELLGITLDDSRRMIDMAREQVTKIAQSLEIEIDTGAGVTEDDAIAENLNLEKFQQKKMQLALEVRDIALVDGVALGVSAAPSSLDDILMAIQSSLYILFGFQNIIFFFRDQESGTLHGKSLAWQQGLINEMSIPSKKGNSVVTDVLFTRAADSSFAPREKGTLTVLDDQIARLMQVEGFYCQPLIAQDVVVGAMLFGLAMVQLPQVEKQSKLIFMFAQQAAQTLAAWHVANEQVQRIEFEAMSASRAKAKQIVHEANNPLSIIKNYIKLLSLRLPKEDPAQGDLAVIKEEIDRVTRIIRQVSETTEARPLEELNVNGVIQDLYRMFHESLFAQRQIAVQTQLDSSLPNIVVDRDKLKQVLINLLKNAAEAVQEGGLLLISTRGKIMLDGNEYIEIALVDNGPGIPGHVMSDLFKPVFSTKGEGHAGLGLSIVKSLVDELKGRIYCQSNEISGTAFQVLLPVAAKQ